jgi:DNA-binding response OmpR family regulator
MQAEPLFHSPKQVLLVDPAIEYRERLILPFEKFGYHVDVAASGPEALTALDDESSDVIVTDLSLPGFDGLELARRIRSRADGGATSIVACTALPLTAPRIEDAKAAGCDLVLTKWYLPWVFVTRVDLLLRQSSNLRASSRVAQERSRLLSIEAARVRERAHEVVERSQRLMVRSAVLPLSNRILNEVLDKSGVTLSVKWTARLLGVDVELCRRALGELASTGFLRETKQGYYCGR